MLRLMLSAVCVLAAAAPLHAESPTLKATDISGRWQGDSYAIGGAPAKLTLDIVACGGRWCGVSVEANNSCGATALKLDAGQTTTDNVTFKGTLALARGTEPYTVQSYLIPASEGDPVRLQVIGDTGGTFRIFRRSFPFEAQLTRTRDAVCKPTEIISMAD